MLGGKLKTTFAALVVFLGLKSTADLPIDAEKQELKLTEEEVKKLKAHFGDNYEKMIKGVNTEIKAYLSGKNLELKAIQDELAALEQENLNSSKIEGKTEDQILSRVKSIRRAMQANDKRIEELQGTIKKLMGEAVGDAPAAIIENKRAMKIEHSATHLFGDTKEWNKFENRPWNARLRDQSTQATNFKDDSVIPLLQGDIANFVRQNPKVLESLFNDTLELPSQWTRRSGIIDRVTDGFIIPGEIVQGRSKGWKPNNNIKIESEDGRVFPKKIDIQFEGYELQQIENTWVGTIYNTEGSHPWKMTFVYFLLTEIIKQQMLDDRKAQINGLYAQTPDGDGNYGRAVNSQDGLRYIFWKAREVTKKYNPTYLGPITDDNIVDKVHQLVMSIPETDRTAEGLELGLSQANLDRYRIKAGVLYTHYYNTDQGSQFYEKNHVIDYPNIIFQPLRDMTNTDFMYITYSKYIEILELDPTEKTKLTTTYDARTIKIFGDYKMGIRIKFIGTKKGANEPDEFTKQKVWTNEYPVFNKDQFVPVFDDGSGVIEFHYSNMVVDKAFTTDITGIDGAPKGMIIRITGNTALAGAVKVKDNANFDLAGNADFNLKLGGTLTLLANEDGTFKELKRTGAPEAVTTPNVATFTGTVIDSSKASTFNFADSANRTITNIINGVEGKTIRIYGSGGGVSVTVADVANVIDVNGNAVLADNVSYVQLTLVDGVWIETKRSITPV